MGAIKIPSIYMDTLKSLELKQYLFFSFEGFQGFGDICKSTVLRVMMVWFILG